MQLAQKKFCTYKQCQHAHTCEIVKTNYNIGSWQEEENHNIYKNEYCLHLIHVIEQCHPKGGKLLKKKAH